VPLGIPALRERPADIPALVQMTLERLNGRYGKSRRVTPEALDLLCRFDFPGNVRQLQNLLERAYVMAEGAEIAAADLPAHVRAPAGTRAAAAPGRLPEVLAAVEGDLVAQACRRHTRQVDLAQELGVSQATVARLLRKHGLRLGDSDFIQQ